MCCFFYVRAFIEMYMQTKQETLKQLILSQHKRQYHYSSRKDLYSAGVKVKLMVQGCVFIPGDTETPRWWRGWQTARSHRPHHPVIDAHPWLLLKTFFPPWFSRVVRWFHTKVILNIPLILSNREKYYRNLSRRPKSALIFIFSGVDINWRHWIKVSSPLLDFFLFV